LWPEKFSLKPDPDFVAHLEELRRRLLIALIAFAIVTVASYFFSRQLLDLLIEPLRRYQDVELFFHKPYEAFLIHLKVAALSGILISSPVFITQLWLFISPGLYTHEKKIVIPLILISILMFLTGAAFAYGIVIPWGLHFLLSFQTEGMKPLLGVGPYFSFLIGMILAFGVLFDFPIAIVGLVRLGVLQTARLKRGRRTVIVLILIASAVLTPSPDPVSQLLLAVPLLFLFELSLLVAGKIEAKRS